MTQACVDGTEMLASRLVKECFMSALTQGVCSIFGQNGAKIMNK